MARQPKPKHKTVPESVVLRMASRITRLSPEMRGAYVARARTESKSKHPTRNADAVLTAAES